MSEAEQKSTPTGEHPVTNGELKRSLTWHDIRTLGTLVVSIFVGGGLAVQFVAHEARAQADASTAIVGRHADDVDARLTRHERDTSPVHAQITADVREVQADIRALYRYQKTGDLQPRLEKAAAQTIQDGGTQ